MADSYHSQPRKQETSRESRMGAMPTERENGGEYYHQSSRRSTSQPIDTQAPAPLVPQSRPKVNMDEVFYGIFVGTRHCTKDPEYLREYGITAVLSVMDEYDEYWNTDEFHRVIPEGRHMFVKLQDDEDANIIQYFSDTTRFIEKMRASANAFINDTTQYQRDSSRPPANILVHCRAGVSRSATLAMAWMLYRARWRGGEDMSVRDALNIARETRPQVNPNSGFRYQLRLWQDFGFSIYMDPLGFQPKPNYSKFCARLKRGKFAHWMDSDEWARHNTAEGDKEFEHRGGPPSQKAYRYEGEASRGTRANSEPSSPDPQHSEIRSLLPSSYDNSSYGRSSRESHAGRPEVKASRHMSKGSTTGSRSQTTSDIAATVWGERVTDGIAKRAAERERSYKRDSAGVNRRSYSTDSVQTTEGRERSSPAPHAFHPTSQMERWLANDAANSPSERRKSRAASAAQPKSRDERDGNEEPSQKRSGIPRLPLNHGSARKPRERASHGK